MINTTTPVFVSHSWGDKTFVDKLVNDLEGVADFWYDSRETKPGEHIDQDVSQGIESCDMMLLIWSVNASRSQWVPLELDQATSLGKPSFLLFWIQRRYRTHTNYYLVSMLQTGGITMRNVLCA
ncbi:MAG: toll/interleukin-1 receptor domain-containing protein [Candidatus Thiodiazotropha sp. (ex Ustalcina ferruginea)]|nr:toll/interleukin-1 receptor domain-containing protein [Candidatus Thiodiazotropha sp. (ex Ustalcina ferruginea)]